MARYGEPVTPPPPLRIFLATPGDLVDQRATVRVIVDEYNARKGDQEPNIELVGWESVRGTARRPQEEINLLIQGCHFLICLFKDKWGSSPGGARGYTSGTEEELFTALLQLGQSERLMRDVWVGFIAGASPEARVGALKAQMASRHSMMYEGLADDRQLREKLSERITTWGRLSRSKVPREIDMIPASGQDVLRAASLRNRGELLIKLGQPGPGALLLKEASQIGGPDEKLSYARHLARNGELQEAHSLTQLAIDYYAGGGQIYSSLAAEAFAAQASVLRRQGQGDHAQGRLLSALALVTAADDFTVGVRCRILDDLGLAAMRDKDLPQAREYFCEALRARQEMADTHAICQSKINLARVEVGSRDLDAALKLVVEVLKALKMIAPSPLHANAEVLGGQVSLRQGRGAEAIAYGNRALALNLQMGSQKGQAVAYLLRAQA
jgi:hypothetical protein